MAEIDFKKHNMSTMDKITFTKSKIYERLDYKLKPEDYKNKVLGLYKIRLRQQMEFIMWIVLVN
ncbi:hypothetical protein MASR1M65_19080 [Saprospiraceae bacterium]